MSELRVREPARDVPVVSEVDVAVAGGGTAGCMAAVGAAREGARTCLIENLGALGGAWNPCIIGHFGNRFVTRDGLRLVGGAPREVLERTLALGSHPYASVAEALTQLSIFYRADHCGEVLLQMMDESKVELWLQARFCAAQPAPGGGYDLFIETKGGRLAIRAKEVVDCTGEADVAAAMGAPMKVAANRSWGYLFEMG
ncbi:MAG TPA: FAD-dependent oxidoreductase, partial [Candidatus Brocadiia bacterium]|nr:FAD-dependent oxidoreductase [Candidatus Brocadiia bacterium]